MALVTRGMISPYCSSETGSEQPTYDVESVFALYDLPPPRAEAFPSLVMWTIFTSISELTPPPPVAPEATDDRPAVGFSLKGTLFGRCPPMTEEEPPAAASSERTSPLHPMIASWSVAARETRVVRSFARYSFWK